MAHGGSRPGAGRKPGAATKMNEAARKAALETGLTPLEYMLRVLRDITLDEETRMDAAKAAAPYVHAKLSSIEQKIEQTNRTVVALPDQAPTVEDWKDKVSARH